MNGLSKRERFLVSALTLAAAGAYFAYRRNRLIATCRFRGKVVAITGGSRGLGLELARLWAQEGARVAICARTPADLERAERELVDAGHEVFFMPCDVTQRDQAAAFINRVVAHWGSVDVLVNNAGIIQTGPLDCMTLEDFNNALATHFWGPLYLMQAVLPLMGPVEVIHS